MKGTNLKNKHELCKKTKLSCVIPSNLSKFKTRLLKKNKLKRVGGSKTSLEIFKTNSQTISTSVNSRQCDSDEIDFVEHLPNKSNIIISKNAVEKESCRPKLNESNPKLNLDLKPFIIKMGNCTVVDSVFQGHNNKEENDKFTVTSLMYKCDVSSSDSKKTREENGFLLSEETRFDKAYPKNKMVGNFTSSTSNCAVPLDSLCMNNLSANIYELTPSKCLIAMKPGKYLYLIGIVEIELLIGAVEVLGYTLNKQNEKLMVFSLQGSCHLFLKAIKNNDDSIENPKTVTLCRLTNLGLAEKTAKKILKKNDTDCLVIVRRVKTHVSSTVWPQLFENHLPFSIFPPSVLLSQETRPFHSIEHKLECLFEEDLEKIGFKVLKEVPQWSKIEHDMGSKDSAKVVLCGGKSVGKSTLLRFLINRCLQKWERVLVIDLDPGQCEFTVPGCISITIVERPVLGPNYSHLKEPLRSIFLGELDVTKCPECYIEGCKSLIDYSKQNHDNIPWLVNTMGFTRGFGVTLACGIIQNTRPTHVVQIESNNRKLNFPSRLDPGFVHSQKVGAFDTTGDSLDYKLLVIPSGSEQAAVKQRGMSPPVARSLVILSYFSEMMSSEITSLSKVTPYMISMDHIELQTTDRYNLTKIQVAATMNGNLVALCNSKEQNRFPNCLGFGIVRGVDWQTKTMFVITPMSRRTLVEVNCLIKGNIALPESLYYNVEEQVTGHVPYLAYTSGRPTARFAKRDFRTLPVTVSAAN